VTSGNLFLYLTDADVPIFQSILAAFAFQWASVFVVCFVLVLWALVRGFRSGDVALYRRGVQEIFRGVVCAVEGKRGVEKECPFARSPDFSRLRTLTFSRMSKQNHENDLHNDHGAIEKMQSLIHYDRQQ
jgi:hypothetical protein